MRRIPVNPVIDDRLLLLGHIFCPRRYPIQPLTLLGVNDHLNETNFYYIIFHSSKGTYTGGIQWLQ